MSATVAILGGYGTFGGRLMQLLMDEPRLTLIIAGRSRDKAEAFRATLRGAATVQTAVFDRDGDVEHQLAAIAPDVVIDASGPFQMYDDPYRVVRAALARGIHYLDLADGSDFVRDIAQFDAQARARNIFVLAGVSSFPVLTAAVVRKLAHGIVRLDTIAAGIAPSPHAGIGLNVVRAIASYAGKPIEIPRSGTHYALTETRRHTIAPPGTVPLRPIRFSLVDVPDLKVLPALWPTVTSVWMGAGPVPGILHRALNILAWGVRLRLLPSLSALAPVMFRAINLLRWGEHRGGMFVTVEGADADGQRRTRSWEMVAEGDDGPFIPSMAAEAIIRRHLAGASPAPGARPAVNDLELADYDALFARRAIVTGVRDSIPAAEPLYRRVLGEAWFALPEAIQALHDIRGDRVASGRASVDRGTGLFARAVAAVIGFPAAGKDVPVSVSFKRDDKGRETWRRTFAGRSFSSTQEEGRGRFEWLVCERFGPVAVGLALRVRDHRLELIVRRWTFLGIPMPLSLAPGGEVYESVEDGRFRFHVELGHPFFGLIVRYRGWLALDA